MALQTKSVHERRGHRVGGLRAFVRFTRLEKGAGVDRPASLVSYLFILGKFI